jgi:hypothetical protein
MTGYGGYCIIRSLIDRIFRKVAVIIVLWKVARVRHSLEG